MKVVERNDPRIQNVDDYRIIVETENHHRHVIIEDEDGVLRWLGGKYGRDFAKGKFDLNKTIKSFIERGIGKNSEEYRELYRNLGVSLGMYWDVFYWGVNNDIAAEYKPTKKGGIL